MSVSLGDKVLEDTWLVQYLNEWWIRGGNTERPGKIFAANSDD